MRPKTKATYIHPPEISICTRTFTLNTTSLELSVACSCFSSHSCLCFYLVSWPTTFSRVLFSCFSCSFSSSISSKSWNKYVKETYKWRIGELKSVIRWSVSAALACQSSVSMLQDVVSYSMLAWHFNSWFSDQRIKTHSYL